ncbi:hypothetical protein OHB26_19775 [Nocardia sp. NBC_01503]|uniref:hypothetical protein n=1 Tax=Nocardia sp. NBC_01503 TaxID=2975997 RepID=UPI002E7C2992|nr:hypothetical protein [Nocardia sp. NBC_01503]WTL29256.1 hypothetical protein OHB26_19775 [Nocardia sp. NBC_01503]
MANTDRNASNYRTVVTNGRNRVVAIDHSLTFPEYRDAEFGIRSDFVRAQLDQPLDAGVLKDVRALHPDRLRAGLSDLGLSEGATEGAVARLLEIQNNGRITGLAWQPGRIE